MTLLTNLRFGLSQPARRGLGRRSFCRRLADTFAAEARRPFFWLIGLSALAGGALIAAGELFLTGA